VAGAARSEKEAVEKGGTPEGERKESPSNSFTGPFLRGLTKKGKKISCRGPIERNTRSRASDWQGEGNPEGGRTNGGRRGGETMKILVAEKQCKDLHYWKRAVRLQEESRSMKGGRMVKRD